MKCIKYVFEITQKQLQAEDKKQLPFKPNYLQIILLIKTHLYI